MTLSRRQLLIYSTAGAAMLTLPQVALAANDTEARIKAFTGGAAVENGKVKIDAPEIAENGNTVPMTVSVDSPMSAADYVESILVLADGNPNAGVATFKFTADSGVAEVNTRIRLATTQKIVAVAKTNTGKFYTASKEVKVTIGGCGG